MTYRTKTYVAGAWEEDFDAVEILRYWNTGDKWKLSFKDAHELTSCRDTSQSCTIKRSLKRRLDASKNFILIASPSTLTRKRGGCQYCPRYNSLIRGCPVSAYPDYRSFINFECDYVVSNFFQFNKIVVLYNSINIQKSYCPQSLHDRAIHRPMRTWKIVQKYGKSIKKVDWCYSNISDILD